ncbi:hypothetical protein GF314_06905 [bacterium]|nr:hypothetical protein [bacterium]
MATMTSKTTSATFLLGLLLALALPARTSQAIDIAVPADAPTIGEAIALASSGDRILVAPGTYAERIDYSGKDLVIESTGGAAVTVIDGGGEPGHVVVFASGESRAAVLRGFTVTGGFGSGGSDGVGAGGGVLVDGASPLIEDCVIADNDGIYGAGLQSVDGDVLVRGTRFVDNMGIQGGGIAAEGGRLVVENCEFEANFAGYGGAIAVLWNAEAELRTSQFTGNSAHQFGGAIYATHAQLRATWLTVVDNGEATPTDDGVGQVFSTFGGGGIYTTGTSGRIELSRFVANTAFAGGGLYIAGDGEMELVNLLVARSNTALGGVYSNTSSPLIASCTIVDSGTFALFTTYNAAPTVANSILAGGGNIGGNGLTQLDYSLVDGSVTATSVGEGNVFGEALLDAAADYVPLAGSPVIDAGDNARVPADVTVDLLGNDRFFDDPGTPDGGNGQAPIVDMGAIEFGSSLPGDSDVTAARDVPGAGLATVTVAPNPFNPRTELRLALDRAADVRVAVYDARGRLVERIDAGRLDAGRHAIAWDGTDRDGRALSAGVYLAIVRAGAQERMVKMSLVR